MTCVQQVLKNVLTAINHSTNITGVNMDLVGPYTVALTTNGNSDIPDISIVALLVTKCEIRKKGKTPFSLNTEHVACFKL